MQNDNLSDVHRVLIVDDQAAVRDGLAALIGSFVGFSVIGVAGTCDEAIALASREYPDIVLLDVLPEHAVFECAAEIMRRCPTSRLLILDDEPHDVHVQQALRLAAAGYLTKQQSLLELEVALRQSMSGQRVFDPQVARRLVFSPGGIRLGPDQHRATLSDLTPREMDVLMHVARGYSVKQCAKVLGISASTVDNHKSRLMKKLHVHKAVELTNLAVREGLLTPMSVSTMPAERAVTV